MPIDSTSVAPRSPVVSSRISNKSTKPLPGVDGRSTWSWSALSGSRLRAAQERCERVRRGAGRAAAIPTKISHQRAVLRPGHPTAKARQGTNMATWGTYEAGLKRIPPEQAVRAMNRLVAPPGAHRSVPMVWGWSAMPTILGRRG